MILSKNNVNTSHEQHVDKRFFEKVDLYYFFPSLRKNVKKKSSKILKKGNLLCNNE